MFFLTFSNMWSFTFFFSFSYIILLLSIIVYLLPVINNQLKYSLSKNKTYFYLINSSDTFSILATPVLLILLINFSWSCPELSIWFGHAIYTNFQTKILTLLGLSFLLFLGVFTSTTYLSSKEIYDFIITTFSFFYWIMLLFCSNSIFSTIFVIEVLSTLILLLIVSSTFSSTYFYRNTNLSFGHLFQQSTPFSYIQSILYFFWISLISSLNLFLFCLFFYIKVLTFDWYLVEHIFNYVILNSSLKEIITLSISWYVLMFCLFLKCGVAPLYIWKPTFFKGIPFYTIFMYVCMFYFFLFLFIIHLLTSYFSEVYYFYAIVSLTFIFIGLIILLLIVCETFYLKSFLAVSSLLNSLFVFLSIMSPHIVDTMFFL